MAPLNCCGFRRAVSPEPQPSVLIDTSQTGGRFALSSHTPSRARSHERIPKAQHINGIFALATRNDLAHEIPTASGNDVILIHETESDVRQRGSKPQLHDVVSKLPKRMSRDSGMSKQNSKPRLRNSPSEDEHQRREELKRALHQRVQEDIDEGTNISDGSYDDDAVPIKTPEGTWSRHEGSIQISPKHLSNALRRSESPSAYAELNSRTTSQAYAPKNTAMALSRMLIQRGSSLARESEEQYVNSQVDYARRTSAPQKYSFSDEDSPIGVPKTRSISPLGRSSTVLHRPSSIKPLEINLANPEFLNMLPMCLRKIRDSPAGGGSRPSSNEASEASALGSARLPGVYDTKIRPASEQLLHGASGLWDYPVHSRHSNTHSTTNETHTSSSNEHCCNPGNEEMWFGGTDGKIHSPPMSERAESLTRQRGHSEGSVPQRLASTLLLPSVSWPRLEHPKRDRSYVSGASSRMFSVRRPSQPSSSVSTGGKQSRTPASHLTTSSIYSSGSLPPSPPDSTLHINSLSDKLYCRELYQPSENIINVSATKPKRVDLDNLERRTVETSYHSSNESLMNRELKAAETRISPLLRANTLKNSRFREDLNRISDELALTNPPRRRVSNLDGARSPADEDATSIWEKALREHSREDKAISHTRIASTFPDLAGPRELDPKTVASTGQKARKGSSFLSTNDRRVAEPLEGRHLQAHLAAYTLPPRRENPRKRPSHEGIKSSSSTIRASTWARYPSHTRPERSISPAGVADQVYSRDFAITAVSTVSKKSLEHHGSSALSNGKKEKAKSLNFGKQMLSTLSSLYKSQSQELQRRLANEARGNRSSISEGGVLEYPELEMVGSISPPIPSPDIASKLELEEQVRKESEPQSNTQTHGTHLGQVSRKQSQDWAKDYQDCIHPQSKRPLRIPAVNPRDNDNGCREQSPEEAMEVASDRPRKASGTIGPKDIRAEGSSSADLRASTLDFNRNVELGEWKA